MNIRVYGEAGGQICWLSDGKDGYLQEFPRRKWEQVWPRQAVRTVGVVLSVFTLDADFINVNSTQDCDGRVIRTTSFYKTPQIYNRPGSAPVGRQCYCRTLPSNGSWRQTKAVHLPVTYLLLQNSVVLWRKRFFRCQYNVKIANITWNLLNSNKEGLPAW